jgi:energy-coupling factor transport system permease protein
VTGGHHDAMTGVPTTGGWLARRDATAKFAAAALVTGALFFSLSPLSSLIAIVLELAVAPFAGLGPRTLARRGWPLLVSATSVFVFSVLFSATGHPVYDAFTYALRLIAVALPGYIVFVTIDPTDLADSLMAYLKVPPRFALGTLVALRLMPLLQDEWVLLTLARRARGIDAGWNPVARVRLAFSTMFALLVGAIRRGTRLAVALDARGFDSGHPRTSARTVHFDAQDALVILVGAGVATICLVIPHIL